MSTTIALSKSYSVHGRTFDRIELREPKYKDVVAVGGEVWDHQPMNGTVVTITHYDRLEKYVARLIIAPYAEDVSELCLADALLLERTIARFFTEAEASLPPLTSLSGTPAKPLETLES